MKVILVDLLQLCFRKALIFLIFILLLDQLMYLVNTTVIIIWILGYRFEMDSAIAAIL